MIHPGRNQQWVSGMMRKPYIQLLIMRKNLKGKKKQECQSKGNNLTSSQVKTMIDLLFQEQKIVF